MITPRTAPPVSNLDYGYISNDGANIYYASGAGVDFYRYNLAGNSWHQLANLPANGTQTTVFGPLGNGFLFVPAPAVIPQLPSTQPQLSGAQSGYYYNPGTDSWMVVNFKNASQELLNWKTSPTGTLKWADPEKTVWICVWSRIEQTHQWASDRTFCSCIFGSRVYSSASPLYDKVVAEMSLSGTDVNFTYKIKLSNADSVYLSSTGDSSTVISAGQIAQRLLVFSSNTFGLTSLPIDIPNVDAPYLGDFTGYGQYVVGVPEGYDGSQLLETYNWPIQNGFSRASFNSDGYAYLVEEGTSRVWKYSSPTTLGSPISDASGVASFEDVSDRFFSTVRSRAVVIDSFNDDFFFFNTEGDYVSEDIVESAVSTAYPAGRSYYAELTPFTTFASFVSFGASPVSVAQSEPSGTYVRYGFKFSAGDSVRVWDGGQWAVLTGDPILNGMTKIQVEALNAANMEATNGFNSGSPYLKLVVYLKTDSSSSTPYFDGVTLGWVTGASAPLSWASYHTTDVPISGGSDLPSGTYVWTTTAGYRIEDGNTDQGETITHVFETQEITAGDNQSSVLREVEVEIQSVGSATVTVQPITDDEYGTAKTVAVTAGTDVYHVGVVQPSSSSGTTHRGWAHRARVSWTGSNVTVNSVGYVVEVSGRTRP